MLDLHEQFFSSSFFRPFAFSCLIFLLKSVRGVKPLVSFTAIVVPQSLCRSLIESQSNLEGSEPNGTSLDHWICAVEGILRFCSFRFACSLSLAEKPFSCAHSDVLSQVQINLSFGYELKFPNYESQ